MPADLDDKTRFARMAEDYDAMAPFFVPMYEPLQTEMIRLTRIAALPTPHVVDLGAGSGRLLERVLDANPNAICTWVDSSEGFRSVAERRLARYADRVRWVLMPMEADWPGALAGPADAVLSMSAIHHLEHAEKRDLYARAHRVLKPGGWFVNTDEMKSVSEPAYRRSLSAWVDHVEAAVPRIPEALRGNARQWREHFARWKERNIVRIDHPKTKGDDLHEPYADQIRWLNEIGYENVDLYVKFHLWCMIAGTRRA